MLAGLGAGMSEAIIAVTPSETIKQVYSPGYFFLAYLVWGGGRYHTTGFGNRNWEERKN